MTRGSGNRVPKGSRGQVLGKIAVLVLGGVAAGPGLACGPTSDWEEPTEVTDDSGDDGGSGEAAVVILSPGVETVAPRNHLLAAGGYGARVVLSARAPESMEIEWLEDGVVLGRGRALEAVLQGGDEVTIDARALATDGREAGRARRVVRLGPAPGGSCLDVLSALGVAFTAGPVRPGVVMPVTVSLPLNGLALRSVGVSSSRTALFADCTLALALWRAAEVLRPLGVVRIDDYGTYSYRCINQSVSPPCPGSKLSQHAFATAIDVAVLETADGVRHSVLDDWSIDGDGVDPCDASARAGSDAFLHEAACALLAARVFKITLTPNYNDAHRNHFHFDLTPGDGWIIRRELAPHGAPEE